jgi:menaquinone-dependent protoporphyrinogen oxidase
MNTIQILYSSSEGQAALIADRVTGRLRAEGYEVQCENVNSAVMRVRPTAVLLIASIHVGKHATAARAFVKRNLPLFNEIPAAFMSVSLSASEPDRARAQGYISAFLDDTGWRPRMTATVAGALRYTSYGFLKRMMIRRIAAQNGMPTDTSRDHEFTDWDEVNAFVNVFGQLVQERVPA